MGYLRYRRSRSLGRGYRLTVTNKGPRLGYRKGPISTSEGIGGNYSAVRIMRGLWYVLNGRRR